MIAVIFFPWPNSNIYSLDLWSNRPQRIERLNAVLVPALWTSAFAEFYKLHSFPTVIVTMTEVVRGRQLEGPKLGDWEVQIELPALKSCDH